KNNEGLDASDISIYSKNQHLACNILADPENNINVNRNITKVTRDELIEKYKVWVDEMNIWKGYMDKVPVKKIMFVLNAVSEGYLSIQTTLDILEQYFK